MVDEQAEHSEEEEVETGVDQDQTGKQVVDTSEILSEPELDYDGSDHEDPRHQEPPIEIEGQIKTEPKYYLEEGSGYEETEDGYEHEHTVNLLIPRIMRYEDISAFLPIKNQLSGNRNFNTT